MGDLHRHIPLRELSRQIQRSCQSHSCEVSHHYGHQSGSYAWPIVYGRAQRLSAHLWPLAAP